jgi:hypothetical protein
MSTTRKFHSIAALCGDGLRPELQALFERLAVDPRSELFTTQDGMVQSGPDPVSAAAPCSHTASGSRRSDVDNIRHFGPSQKISVLELRPCTLDAPVRACGLWLTQ